MTTSVNADIEAFAAEAENVSNVNPVADAGVDSPAATNQNGQKFYTEEDLAKVRAQEKDKLYPQIEKLKEELDSIKRVTVDKEAEKAAKLAEREAAKAEKAKKRPRKSLKFVTF